MRTLCWTAAVALPITIGLSALLAWPVQAAPNRDALPQTEIASCLIIDEEIFGGCGGAQPNETQTHGLRLAFDQTTPPKKGKKRKKLEVPSDPTTGIVDSQRRQRSHGVTTTGVQVRAPKVLTPARANNVNAGGGGTVGGGGTNTARTIAPPPAPTGGAASAATACTGSKCPTFRSNFTGREPRTIAPPPPGQSGSPPSGTAQTIAPPPQPIGAPPPPGAAH